MSDDNRHAAYLSFLRRYVETFEELEVVLALGRSGDRGGTPAGLATELNLPLPVAVAAIDRLASLGLLIRVRVPGAEYRINRDDSDVALGVNHLLSEYAANRLGVMSQMSANALDRVRTSAMRTFARAFLLGGKKDG